MEIPISTALRDSATTTVGNKPHFFSIEFVLQSGEIRSIKRAARFMKAMSELKREKKTDRKFYSLKENSLILVRDTDASNGHPYPVNIHCITRYNNLIVRH